MEKTRAGIQSVEVGFGLLDVLARATGPLMLRDLALASGMSAAKWGNHGPTIVHREESPLAVPVNLRQGGVR